MSAAASGLNSFFSGYDKLILTALHALACGFLNFFNKFISLLGEKGIIFILLALVLMCFSRTRKFGVCLFGAIACGALITNIILKDAIARPRPFETLELYRQWWEAAGSAAEDGFSFPSGHVTAAAAGCTAFCLLKGKKLYLPCGIWVLLMMIARNYLMVHYPSDVLFGLIIGVGSGFAAWYITKLIFTALESLKDKKWAELCLEWNPPDFKGIPSKLHLLGEEPNFFDIELGQTELKKPETKSIKMPKIPQMPKMSKMPGSTYVGKHERH